MWWKDYPVHHFAVVRDGVLYRSGQPDAKQLEHLRGRYHIRTVVNLRGAAPDQEWYRQEAEYCRRHGIRMVDIPMKEKANAVGNMEAFMAVVGDHRNHPVLAHCEYGSARTGYVGAAFRIVMDGWSYDKALAEARRLRFSPDKPTNREYDRVLRLLAEGKLSVLQREPARGAEASRASSMLADKP